MKCRKTVRKRYRIPEEKRLSFRQDISFGEKESLISWSWRQKCRIFFHLVWRRKPSADTAGCQARSKGENAKCDFRRVCRGAGIERSILRSDAFVHFSYEETEGIVCTGGTCVQGSGDCPKNSGIRRMASGRSPCTESIRNRGNSNAVSGNLSHGTAEN